MLEGSQSARLAQAWPVTLPSPSRAVTLYNTCECRGFRGPRMPRDLESRGQGDGEGRDRADQPDLLSIAELSERVVLTRRMIRYDVARGLLPAPVGHGAW